MRTPKLLTAVGLVILFFAACLLVPCIERIPDGGPRLDSAYTLKVIGIALHTYHDVFKKPPPVVVRDKEGKPLYSWRILMLPYLEEKPLYEQFRLDEPWDSPQNLKLLEATPECYRVYWPDDPPGKTRYQLFTGPGTALEPGLPWPPSAERLMAAESGQPVLWTKPADIVYDPNGPLPPLGAGYAKSIRLLCSEIGVQHGFNACFGDGRVRFVRDNADEQVLRGLITGTLDKVDWSKVE
jgi:hypothetical protein